MTDRTATIAVWGGERGPRFERATQVPGGAQRVVRIRRLRRVARGRHRSPPRTHLRTQHQPDRGRVRGEGQVAGGRRGGHLGLHGMASSATPSIRFSHRAHRSSASRTRTAAPARSSPTSCPASESTSTYGTPTDFDAIEEAVAAGCDVLYLETPTNPTLKVLDLERLTAAGHAVGATVIVDNTFATPINQNPLELGADLVVHSATKFLGGHADALGGVVVGSESLVHDVYHYREINGATLHPMAAYLLLRGMKTLHLRIERQGENAHAIAEPSRDPPQGAGRELPRAGLPPSARHRRPSDARVRRHAQLRSGRRARCRTTLPPRPSGWRTARPTSARSRRSSDRRRPPATSSAPPRSGPPGHPRRADPLLDGNRGRRRPARGSRPSARRRLTMGFDQDPHRIRPAVRHRPRDGRLATIESVYPLITAGRR
jgi:hypothetical protein